MKKQLNIMLDAELLARFKKECFLSGLGMSTVIESLIYAFLDGSISYDET